MGKYFGIFTDRDHVAQEFEYGSGNRWSNENPFVIAADFPTDEEVLLATYNYENYNGSAYVLFKRDGKLYEVIGAHCSCNGSRE